MHRNARALKHKTESERLDWILESTWVGRNSGVYILRIPNGIAIYVKGLCSILILVTCLALLAATPDGGGPEGII